MQYRPSSTPSIFPRIEFAAARHRYSEWAQSVQDLHAVRMMRQHFRQTPIGHRTFIEVGADQHHAPIPQPGIHLLAREPPLRFLAAMQPAGTVYGRIQRSTSLFAVDAL